MTEATFASNGAVNTQSDFYHQSIDASIDEPINLAAERLRAVRKTIAGARPVLPDSTSRKTKLLTAQKIGRDAKPVAQSAVAQYLSGFGLEDRPENYSALRYHPAVLHEPTRRYYPAMLAPVHDVGGEFVGIHRTYLLPDGSGRAPVDAGEDRRMLGLCFGSYVQLRPVKGFRLVITKDVEAALVIQQSCPDLPVWAAMTLGNMKSVVPSEVREIIICPSDDKKTPNVADKILMDAVREQMSRGLTVLIAQPLPGMKLNDMRLR